MVAVPALWYRASRLQQAKVKRAWLPRADLDETVLLAHELQMTQIEMGSDYRNVVSFRSATSPEIMSGNGETNDWSFCR